MAVQLQPKSKRGHGLQPMLYAFSVCDAQHRCSCKMRLVELYKCCAFALLFLMSYSTAYCLTYIGLMNRKWPFWSTSVCMIFWISCDNVASSLRRAGGHFVCKLFDVFTRFSVGLVYLMHRAFEHVALFKPVTSRPANSERFAYYSMSLHFSLLVEALTLFYD